MPNMVLQAASQCRYLSIFASYFASAFVEVWATCGSADSGSSAWLTYRQQKVNHVHNAKNDIADVGPTIGVRDVHQETRHTVVEKHLPKVFSSFFQVDGEECL